MLKKHRIKITLLWDSIYKDVCDKAYRMARLTKLGVQDEAAGEKLESEITLTDEDFSIIKRAMREGLAEVVNTCAEYVWSKSHLSDDKTIASDQDVTIILMMPLTFNLAGCSSIATEIHAYIVARALSAWFLYTGISQQHVAAINEQKALAIQARTEITRILYRRVRPLRKGEELVVIVGDAIVPPVFNCTWTMSETGGGHKFTCTLTLDSPQMYREVAILYRDSENVAHRWHTFPQASIAKNMAYEQDNVILLETPEAFWVVGTLIDDTTIESNKIELN